MIELLNWWNSVAWVTANVLVAYIAFVLVVFVTGYYVLFDPSATTAGKFVFRFALSLVGVIGLVFISLFIDPTAGREWWTFPGDAAPWRPTLRLVAYGYVAFTVTALAALLYLRKFHPNRLRTAPNDSIPVKVRRSKES